MSTDSVAPMLDEFAICKLSHRYAQALDRNDQVAWAALFTADAVIESGNSKPRGYSEIMRIPVDQLKRYKKTLHSVTTQVITLSGDTALGEVYCTAYHIYEDFHQNGRFPFDLSHNFLIRYEDAYRRVDGQWMFTRRRISTEARFVHQIIPVA
ncbi:nuclear transport factor 2 family protein [Microvirga antarctica]|uniref:nuclear transport factor 2 family protein n=1 Tax=Microvirga antarctica TaxID=2819233 RepID=UPI001B3130BC|nr:nuclear transport factor 2 family protein [Microvirga antarctica]